MPRTDVEGKWSGKAAIFGHQITVVLHIVRSDGVWQARIDCIEPGFFDIPVQRISICGTDGREQDIRLDIALLSLRFQGRFDATSQTIDGTMFHETRKVMLHLMRATS